MRRDAVGAGGFGRLGRMHGVRMAAAPRIADGRHVVDIDAEAKVAFHDLKFLISPRSPATVAETAILVALNRII